MKFYVEDGISARVALSMHSWSCIKNVKNSLQDILHIPSVKQRLFFAGQELKNAHNLHDCFLTEGCTVLLVTSSPNERQMNLINVYGDIRCESEMQECIVAARAGLALGLAPRLSLDGTGGTYFLRNRSKCKVAVFKAEDEEPFAPNNPRGYVGELGGPGMRAGLLSGEGAVREVAAYLLDYDRVAGVPATTRVEVSRAAFNQGTTTGSGKRLSSGLNFFAPTFTAAHKAGAAINTIANRDQRRGSHLLLPTSPSSEFESQRTKIGSLQVYVEYDELAGDLDPAHFPVKEVQKIALLDIRLVNIDRNEANILVQRKYPAAKEQDNGFSPNAPVSSILFSPPLGPSHLHHYQPPHSPGNPFSFSPPLSPPSHHYTDSPAFMLTPSTAPLSPTDHGTLQQHHSDEVLPPPATNLAPSFNLNYPASRSYSFSASKAKKEDEQSGNTSFDNMSSSPSIPIPIRPVDPSLSPSIASTASRDTVSWSPLSSSLPNNPPSRLQARLVALKAARQQQAPVQPTYHLIPIDHAYILPDTLELACVDWCWLEWPQIRHPLCPELKSYILSLDIKADIQLLRDKFSIREECLKVMRISGLFLQKAVAADLTLYDIATCICRSNLDKPSQLEVWCAQAATLARSIKHNVKRNINIQHDKKNQQQQPQSPTINREKDTTIITLITSAPTSPRNKEEQQQHAQPSTQLAGEGSLMNTDLSHSVSHKPKDSHSRSLSKEREECKVDDDDTPSPRSRTINPSISPSHGLTTPITSALTSALHQHQQQQAEAKLQQQQQGEQQRQATDPGGDSKISLSRTRPGSLPRSNSLELILRRSISYDDFRGVTVKKQGFGTAAITMNTMKEQEEDNEDQEAEEEEEEEEEANNAEDHHHLHVLANDALSSSGQPSSRMSKHRPPAPAPPVQQILNEDVYRVGTVYHHNGLPSHDKQQRWTDEEYSQLFFSCLNGLMDSHIERCGQQKKKEQQVQTTPTTTTSTTTTAPATAATTRNVSNLRSPAHKQHQQQQACNGTKIPYKPMFTSPLTQLHSSLQSPPRRSTCASSCTL